MFPEQLYGLSGQAQTPTTSNRIMVSASFQLTHAGSTLPYTVSSAHFNGTVARNRWKGRSLSDNRIKQYVY